MTTQPEVFVERGLDNYIAAMKSSRNLDPDGVHVRTLARAARVPVGDMSNYLQQYRWLQSSRNTRYVVACQGYGRDARWSILSKPGSDPLVVRRARIRAARWSLEDMGERWKRDLRRELVPGWKGKHSDKDIENVVGEVDRRVDAVIVWARAELARIIP